MPAAQTILGQARWLLLGTLAAVIVGLIVARGTGGRESVEAAMDQGAEIVTAIEAYRHEHGRLPRKLSDLVPAQLTALPEAPWGDRTWRYADLGENVYQLSVWANSEGYPSVYYQSDSGLWVHDS